MISATALEKIRTYQECMKIKRKYAVKDFHIYNVTGQWGYGISPSDKWRRKKKEYKFIKNPVELEGILERLISNRYKIWYIDECKEFDHLDDFLEYYYITKLAQI